MDGVDDAQNFIGKNFSRNRLLELLAQPSSFTMALLNRITDEIRRHVSDTEQCDDITLLAVRRKNLESTKELRR